MNSKFLDYTALIISIIGAVNWGLIGFFPLQPGHLFIWRYDMDFQNHICIGGYLWSVLLSLFGRISSFSENN